MTAKQLITRVFAMAEPICAQQQVALWDVTFEKEGRQHVLTVFIDRDSGVLIEDCEAVSRAIDPLLDAAEFESLPAYTLCVSSAGLSRRLVRPAHFSWAEGKQIELYFYQGGEGGVQVCTLTQYAPPVLHVQDEQGAREVAISELAKVQLHFSM